MPLVGLAHQKGFDALAAALDEEDLMAVDEALAKQFQVERLKAESRISSLKPYGSLKGARLVRL